MRILAITLSTLVALAGSAVAASEDPWGTNPDCDADQFRNPFWSAVNSAPLLKACEGEHWEGGDEHAANSAVAFQHSGKNGTQDDGPGLGAVGARANSDSNSEFVGLAIGGVGMVNVHHENRGTNQLAAVYLRDNSDETKVTCIAFAAQDCNALAEVVHASPARSGSSVKEETTANDCSQDTYAAGTCDRDNTAITLVAGPGN